MSFLDKDGFVVPYPRPPKKRCLIKQKNRCKRCNSICDFDIYCVVVGCEKKISCQCYEVCAGSNGNGNCEITWCSDHVPRNSIICRIDNCFNVLCKKHAWKCATCKVDACGVHAKTWDQCDNCEKVNCDICLVLCADEDCDNRNCKECFDGDDRCKDCITLY